MDKKILRKSLWLMCFMIVGVGIFDGGTLWAQVLPDCFNENCGGSSGIPQCPEDFDEVGFVLYANSKANATGDCETVVSCTNLGKKTVELSCRFYHGFFPIRDNDPSKALCSTDVEVLPGDTNECATAVDEDSLSGGIFISGDADCPAFEGKGLVCAKGGKASRVYCMALLSCGDGTALESIEIIRRKGSMKNKDK